MVGPNFVLGEGVGWLFTNLVSFDHKENLQSPFAETIPLRMDPKSTTEAIAVADDVAESDADVTWCFPGKVGWLLIDNDD